MVEPDQLLGLEASCGIIVVTEISETKLKGNISCQLDERNFINGSFQADICR